MFELCGSALVLLWPGGVLSPALSGPESHCSAALSPPVSLSAAASSLVWTVLCPVAGVSVRSAHTDSCPSPSEAFSSAVCLVLCVLLELYELHMCVTAAV